MFVPQIILVDEPPIASASEVFGSRFENVAGSDGSFWIGTPFSSTKSRRRRPGVEPEPKISECISPRLELLIPEEPGADALDDRTNSPLLLVGTLGSWAEFNARVGLEEEAYRIGDESAVFSHVEVLRQNSLTTWWRPRSTARDRWLLQRRADIHVGVAIQGSRWRRTEKQRG